MPETTTLEEQIKVKQTELRELVENPPENGKHGEHTDKLKSVQTELTDLHGQRKNEAEAAKAKQMLSFLGEVDPAERLPTETEEERKNDETAGKTVGEIFTESDAFKDYSYGGVSQDVKVERSLDEMRNSPATKATRMEAAIKTLFQTSAGFAPDSPRGPEIVGAIHRPVQLLDRLRQVPTTLENIKWMEQTTRTAPPSNANTSEGARYREVTIAYTERTADIIKKTAWLPVTEEQMADVPFVEDLVSAQLPSMLGESIDNDVVNGAGTTGTLIGLESLSTRGTRTKEDDESVYAAIVRGIGDVQVTGRATPDLILMHTLDWFEMILEQGRDGNYIFGMLAQQGQTPWGIPVVQCDFLSRGQYIVGDFARYMMIRDRQDVRTRLAPRYDVQITLDSSPGGDTVSGQTAPTGQVMIFSDVRVQCQWLRPQAFVDIN